MYHIILSTALPSSLTLPLPLPPFLPHQEGSIPQHMCEALLAVGLKAAASSHIEGEGGGGGVVLLGGHSDTIAQLGHLQRMGKRGRGRKREGGENGLFHS